MISTPTEKKKNRLLKALKIINLVGAIALAYWSVVITLVNTFMYRNYGIDEGSFLHPTLLIISTTSFIMHRTKRYTLNKLELVISIVIVITNTTVSFSLGEYYDFFELFVKLIATIISTAIIILYPVSKILLVKRLQKFL